ncbi:uncharacterized protein LOC129962211 [Argiope bruennichi]|uniref:uncharacterized protein LOC129962211 n=1 Tax=Argiope bruennichi TaxID=94029 RepID=UPI002495581B|nr:uncharacterized protein LOC129962211 [Argiope bruennichi]
MVKETAANSQSKVVAMSFQKNRSKNVLLRISISALVKNKYSEFVEVRCLLDVGSQSCLCKKACAERLHLRLERINTVVSCVNDAAMVVNNCVITTVANKDRSFEPELSMLVVSKITDVTPNKVINVSMEVLGLPSLADPSFNIPGKIELLLGAEVFYELLRPGQFRDLNSSLLLQNIVFGYVASDSVDEVKKNKVHCGLILDVDLNRTMRKFWEIQNVDNEVTKSQETFLCEERFVKTHRRNEEGRYVLTMPLKEDLLLLGTFKGHCGKKT